jgi:hypothetical protein
MKLLEYLYCRFYQLMVSVGNGDIPGFASIMLMTIMIGLNCTTVVLLSFVFGHPFELVSKPVWVIGFLSPAPILYFLFVYDGKSDRIVSRYEGEPRRARIKGRIIVIGYMVLSLAAFVGSAFLLMMKNRGVKVVCLCLALSRLAA